MCSILIIVHEQCPVARTQGLKSRVKGKRLEMELTLGATGSLSDALSGVSIGDICIQDQLQWLSHSLSVHQE